MPILPVPPAFPVPVLPQVFDTSLSYYELLAKLTQAVNAVTVQVNQNTANIASLTSSVQQIQQALESLGETVSGMQTAITEIQEQLDGVPAEVQELIDGLAQEKQERQDADQALAQQLANWANLVQAQYVSYEDLEGDYLLGGITFQMLTMEEYEALAQKVPRRVYFIWTGSTIVIRYQYTETNSVVVNSQAIGQFMPDFQNFVRGGVLNFVPESEV